MDAWTSFREGVCFLFRIGFAIIVLT